MVREGGLRPARRSWRGFVRDTAVDAFRSGVRLARSNGAAGGAAVLSGTYSGRHRLMPPLRSGRRVKRRWNTQAETTRRPAVSKRAGLSKKRKRPVKVSKNFSEKVRKVIKSKQFNGFYMKSYGLGVNFDADNCTLMTAGAGAGFEFRTGSVPQILDAFSVLWNQKPTAQNENLVPGTIGTVLSGGVTKTTDHFKGEVVSMSKVIYFRNDSQVAYEMDLVECTARRKQTTYPYDDFPQILGMEGTIANQNTQPGPNLGNTGIVSTTSYAIGVRPGLLPSWRKLWKSKTTKVKLEPGQSYAYVLKCGPLAFDQRKHGYLYDASQQLANTATMIPNYTKYLMAFITPEFSVDSDGKAGRYKPLTGNLASGFINYAIWVDMHDRIRLKCPEQALNVSNQAVAGTAQLEQVSMKQDAYLFYSGYQAKTGSVRRTDDEQPASTETQ